MALASTSECSLHVTIAVPTADLCGSSFLLQAAAAVMSDAQLFRRSVPLGPLLYATSFKASSTVPHPEPPSFEPRGEARVATYNKARIPPAGLEDHSVNLLPGATASESDARNVTDLNEAHALLWRQLHASAAEMTTVTLEAKVQRHRATQQMTLHRFCSAWRARRGTWSSLRPDVQLCKSVAVELIACEPGGRCGTCPAVIGCP